MASQLKLPPLATPAEVLDACEKLEGVLGNSPVVWTRTLLKSARLHARRQVVTEVVATARKVAS